MIGASELRVDFAPGYRVYFMLRSGQIQTLGADGDPKLSTFRKAIGALGIKVSVAPTVEEQAPIYITTR